ncbi:SusD/RagB family nutrient-binding outer membrane lipoprotein [Sinomicrobium sp.]
MKKYILITLVAVGLYACSDDKYEDYNIDGKNPPEVSADYLFTAATKSLSDQMATPNVNLNIFRFVAQYLTSTEYLEEPNYDLTGRNIPGGQWERLSQRVLFNLKNASENIDNNLVISETQLTEEEVAARKAQIEVLMVYTWQVMVDTFGNIPYSEALDINNTLPVYDDAATIYEDLINRLIAINSDFDAAQGFETADVLYNGDMQKWKKFSNSLLLRLGMRLADVNPSLAQTAVEAAVANGVFESNADNALIHYESLPTNSNPLWQNLIQSGRSDYVAANTLVDYMNDLNDPRRPIYFDDNLDGGIYVGGVYGDSNTFANFSHMGEDFVNPEHPAILLDYAEVEFLLAEAAERGIGSVTGAANHYNEAITASITFWGGTTDDANDYIAQTDVAYSSADWKEKIGLQFWIAMYDNPTEGWSVWRKYDAPTLNLPADSGNPIPLRYTYPVDEQNLNPDNREAAAAAIGGDEQQTPIFWDVHSLLSH